MNASFSAAAPATSLIIPPTSSGLFFAQSASFVTTGRTVATSSLSRGNTVSPKRIPSSVSPFFNSCKLFAVVVARVLNSLSIDPL
ncbi:hypothetical protein D3C81_1926350 [compost metagenome]